MNTFRPWMLYGAAGHTGAMVARQAAREGHRPVLAGRSEPALATLAQQLDLTYQVVALDDPAALAEALAGVDLVLNAAGPFLHTAQPLAETCIASGTHYLDISNELQVFRALYDLDHPAQQAGVAVIPGVGFGTVVTNCLARYVSDAVGGAETLEVASRVASAQPGPGAAATMAENLPYGGWIRRSGELVPQELFTGITRIEFPDGLCEAMPVPTGDLEAAYWGTGAQNVVAYAVSPPNLESPTAVDVGSVPTINRSFGWARAVGREGSAAEAWLETGESYKFTAAASVRAVEECLASRVLGANSPATAFGGDFALKIEHTNRIESIPVQP
jgi:short subunit dehydrogenase-like uncharacterized protein